jgi:hypothetical protein
MTTLNEIRYNPATFISSWPRFEKFSYAEYALANRMNWEIFMYVLHVCMISKPVLKVLGKVVYPYYYRYLKSGSDILRSNECKKKDSHTNINHKKHPEANKVDS